MGDVDPNNDPTQVVDSTPFPNPDLYFRVFDSERDEPDSKYREDVFKLYERWEKKYGRKWPENGMNTEDLVWLYNEAYKDEEQEQQQGGGGGGKPRRPKTRANEKQDYDGQFMTATEDAVEAARASLPADPAARAAAAARARAEVQEGVWVTDEFESEAYEAGNMEALHGGFLWDKEGKPTIMPEGPPKEEMGEGSEGWSDFYGSLRPRHVESDDVRDALWATDEFESDEDNTESEWEPEYVGAGLGLRAEDPINWQYSLRHSNHPLAPFPGEPLKWSSFVYDDGTTYEGVTREAVPHGTGVMVFGRGTGAGMHLREVALGDKYEGEFQAGYAHGLGQATSAQRGEVYIGEFFAGQRHGCGVRIDMRPFYYLVERGVDPVEAHRRTHRAIMKDMEFRTWYRGQPLGDAGEAESVLVTVREDEAGGPWDPLVRNFAHEAKLRNWKRLAPEEKAAAKLAEVLDKLHSDKHGFGGSYHGFGSRTSLNETGGLGVASAGASEDSIELMVGRDEDGVLGPGWFDATDSELYPMEERLRTQVAVEALQDKVDESEDKEAVLGGDVLNPTTGLSLKDYLEGREAQHNELLLRAMGGRGALRLDDDTTHLNSEDLASLNPVKLGAATEDLLLESMRRHEAAWADDTPYPRGGGGGRAAQRNWADEATDTRFETESDMMELCDLAEILGTMDEVEEIVAKARMWRWKPYGEVTLRFAQDAQGAPVELLQEPLHYPHGTKWMAPGPLGQCHPLPEDRAVRAEMARVARNHAQVYNMYNFDWDPEPGGVQHLIDQRVRRGAELQGRRVLRMAGGLDAAEAEAAAAAAGPQPGQLLAELPEGEQEEGTTRDGRRQQQQQQQRQGAAPPALPFGSITLAGGRGAWPPLASLAVSQGIGRASRAVAGTLARAARHAPPVSARSGRPRLSRPSAAAAAAAAAASSSASGIASSSSRRQQKQKQQNLQQQ